MVGLHAVAGLLQMGVNTMLLLAGFVIFFGWLRGTTLRGRLSTIVVAFVFVGLGTALAAPYVLPIVEGVRAAYNKNVPFLAFFTIPSANAIAFFFPLTFGQVFQSWIPGRYPEHRGLEQPVRARQHRPAAARGAGAGGAAAATAATSG